MPINPNIPMGVQPFQMPQQDPNQQLNALARIMQMQDMRSNQQVNALKIDEMKRGVEEGNALHNVLKTPGFAWDDPTHRNSAFAAAPTKAQDLFKGHIELQGKVGENKKRDFEMAKEGYSIFQKTVAAHATNPNATPEGVVMDVRRLVDSGVMSLEVAQKLVATMPQDPRQLQGHLRTILTSQMTPEQQLTAFAPKPEKVDNGQQISYRDTNPNSPTYGQMTGGAPVQKQMTPGEVATDRRAGAQLAETKRHNKETEGHAATTAAAAKLSQPFTVAGPDGKDMLVQQDKTTGQLVPVRGGYSPKGADKDPSEGERKAATLLKRLEGSQKQLEAALKTNPGAAKPELLASGLRAAGAEAVANTITGTQRQQVESAQLDMLDAALTLGTGAAYTREQLEGYRKSYFPQLGDDPPTIKDKQDRLNNVIQAAKIAAGRAAKPQGGATGGWSIQKVE